MLVDQQTGEIVQRRRRFRNKIPNGQGGFSKMGNLYEVYLNNKGVKCLRKKKEQQDLYERTQMHMHSCDLLEIIRRVTAGDVRMQDFKQGKYEDITNCPTSIHETFDLMHRVQNGYDRLPPELKEHFGNDMMKFATATKEDLDAAFEKMQEKRTPEKLRKKPEQAPGQVAMKLPETKTNEGGVADGAQ